MSPYDCPSLFTILPFIEYEYGIWHPIGGCNALMTAMAQAAEELGVTIHTDAEVTALDFDTSGKAPRVTGLTVNGQHHTHDNVVINADATWALKHLIPEPLRARKSGWTNDTIDSKKYSCSTYMLYLGINGEVTHLPHHTIFVSELYKENLADISQNGGLSEDPSVYICNPTQIDPSLAPDGKSALYVLMPTPNTREGRALDWTEADRADARERVLSQMERRFGIENVESRIEAEHEITPAGWQAQNINHGATFNLAHNLGQMLHKRPQHELNGFEGVYLVGGGTHPGSGLPVIFLSSQITAKILCDKLGLTYAGASHAMNTREGAERSRQLTESKLAPASELASV
jgi:phytoene desaturase